MLSRMPKEGVLKICEASMAVELKKELQRLVKAIVEDDDVAEDEALMVLNSLKDLKFEQKPSSFKISTSLTIPEEFKCPISRELLRDPVILATGLTYDRPFIERWLNEGKRKCPQTQQVLSHTNLTPNTLVQDMIFQWCTEHGLEPPTPRLDRGNSNEKPMTETDGAYLDSLLEKLSPKLPLPNQKEAAKELRTLTKRNPSFRELFSESKDSITRLLSPLMRGRVNDHDDLQEYLITTLLNLSIHERNKSLVTGSEKAIAILVESLRFGTSQTKSNAAAALFTLSDTEQNKLAIGAAGAVQSLIKLLDTGDDHQAMKDSASAIFSLCIVLENKRRAVREGVVPVIVNKIEKDVMVPELLSILALLSVHQRAVEEMDDLNVVPLLLGILRESSCETSKENCIAILYTICYSDRFKLREIKSEEVKYGTVSRLARSGTSRAKRKADGILERINRASLVTHTA